MTNRLMNMAARNVLPFTGMPALSVTTLKPWWLWKAISTSANTNMPRISNTTPVLLMIETSFTP
jgi:hypothetical protein